MLDLPELSRLAEAQPAILNQGVLPVGRTYHDANHDLVVAGDLLPIRLRWSRAGKAGR
jgi:hypothetical protein